MSSSSTAAAAASTTETTRDEAMQNLLTSSRYADITLKGTDGIAVHANRCLLASRSKVFDKMLYGQFSEASTAVVELPYTGEVLKSLVSYIYTDKSELLKEGEDTVEEDTLASTIVALIDAATYYELPVLRLKAEEFACFYDCKESDLWDRMLERL